MALPPLGRNTSYRAFLTTQFLGAFNDNLYKQVILVLASGVLFPGKDMQGLAFAVFAAPFVLVAGLAGEVSERFSKSRVILVMKVAELGIVAAGMVALYAMSWVGMLAVLFTMGIHSAFFGPCKYGGLPEMVAPNDLLRANGLVAMTTFLAVLLGGALPGPLMDALGGSLWLAGLPCIALAVFGFFAAFRIAPLPAQRPSLTLSPNPLRGLGDTLRSLRERPALFAVVLAMSLFWFNGGVLNQAINGMAAPEWLDLPLGHKAKVSALLMTQSIAIIIGSLLAPTLTKRHAPHRVVMTGAVALVTGEVALGLVGTVLSSTPIPALYGLSVAYVFTVACMLITGIGGAVFFVPVNAYLQSAIEAGDRGRAFAANNFLNFLFIFLGGAWYMGLRGALGVAPTFVTGAAGALMLVYLGLARRELATIAFTSEAPTSA